MSPGWKSNTTLITRWVNDLLCAQDQFVTTSDILLEFDLHSQASGRWMVAGKKAVYARPRQIDLAVIVGKLKPKNILGDAEAIC